MEFIKNIEIKNFKSIRHQVIDGCKRINVFIGYPNVGKSNILEALSLFSLNQETKFIDLVRVKEDPTIFFDGIIENTLMVAINNKYGVFGEYLENTLSLNYQVADQAGFFSPVKLKPLFSSSITKELLFRNFELVGQNYEGKNDIANNYIVKRYEFRKNSTTIGTKYSSLQYPFGSNIFSILNTNGVLKNDASELLKDYNLELLYDTRSQSFTILKRTGTGIFTVPYELLADTIQRLIFYKAAIYSNKERILLFEEPEAHMFPPYVRKFTTDVIFDKSNQFFIASHSPYVVDAFLEDATDDVAIYLVYYENGETKVKLMQQKDIEEVRDYGVDLFFNLESYLKHGQIDNA